LVVLIVVSNGARRASEKWQQRRSNIPRGGGASPEGGTGSSGQHGEECLVDERGEREVGLRMRNASYSRHYVEVEVRRRRLELGPFLPTCG